MKIFSQLTSVLFLIAGLATAFGAEESTKSETASERFRRLLAGPHVKRGILPDVKLERAILATDEEAALIKRSIANLANIERPDFGLSGTMSGIAFAPVPGTGKPTGGFLLTNHHLETGEDFRQLVALGPRSLPYLLDTLEDKTPTKLKHSHAGGSGGMFLSMEMGSNPTNTAEQTVIAALPQRKGSFGFGTMISDYTLTVGDVCFVAIGQIVGRAYLAVRYQPTSIIIINSPTKEMALAKAVRDIWSSTNAAQKLFQSLLFDYSTEGVFNGESLDGWSVGSDLQCGAALRLIYYFPQESSSLLANRLAKLDVGASGKDVKNRIRREVANGVRSDEFIKSVSWSDALPIRKELLEIFKRSTDTDILLAASPGADQANLDFVREKLTKKINDLPSDESGPFGEGYRLLIELGNRTGSEAKPVFVRYLEKAGVQRWRTMAQALRKTHSEWASELLAPALLDKREFGWTYPVTPGQNEPRRAIRVCDEAAEAIHESRPDLRFEMAGEHENLDRQIKAMLAEIQKRK